MEMFVIGEEEVSARQVLWRCGV